MIPSWILNMVKAYMESMEELSNFYSSNKIIIKVENKAIWSLYSYLSKIVLANHHANSTNVEMFLSIIWSSKLSKDAKLTIALNQRHEFLECSNTDECKNILSSYDCLYWFRYQTEMYPLLNLDFRSSAS